MGTVLNKISKRAGKFYNALSALERNLEFFASEKDEIVQAFDLKSSVESDLLKLEEDKRKARNKRKAAKRDNRK